MLNSINIMGRLTRAPELRHTLNGIPVASFTLACDRDYGKKDERETDFIDIVAWRHTGEFASTYFQKGQLVAVQGRLQSRKWTDKEGNKRISFEIVADRVHFAEGKKNNASTTDSSDKADSAFSARPASADDYDGFEDDNDLPF